MVGRYAEQKVRLTMNENTGKLLVVDLDGTFVRENTLRMMIHYGIRQLRRRRSYGKLTAVYALLGLRALRLVRHTTLKFGVLGRLDFTDGRLSAEFTNRVNSCINRTVRNMAADWQRAGGAVVLATAAADVYVPWIWTGERIATPFFNNPRREETRGERKAEAVSAYAREKNLEVACVVTDHVDDLPLMLAAPEVVLVQPDAKTRKAVEAAGVTFRTI